ncbi:MAG: hypothetical protein BWX88_04176 [Planctomycetes bacterium ADurb.Bin126]|nr:MAG: hypothetical protein BWX88_04176 [Planctomycetes bacterium ADurb.Bin126]
MHFIRENLFLVCVIAAVVVIGGIMVFLEFNAAAEVDGQLAQRRALADSLKKLGDQARKQLVNQEVVTAAKQRVEMIRTAAKQVREESLNWNRVKYQVLTREITEGDKKVMIPLFPVDEERFRLHALRYHFQDVYRGKLDGLLKDLEPIVPPTNDDIIKAANDWDRELTKHRERRRLIEAREAREGTGRGTAPPTGMGEMMMEGALPPGVRAGGSVDTRPGGRTTLSEADAEAIDLFGEDFVVGQVPQISGLPTSRLASYLGLISARRERAATGNIYASRESLDPVFAWGSTITAPQDALLWYAQVNLWITQDVLGAISQTNKAATQQLPVGVDPSVLVLPIKRLVRLEVSEKSGEMLRPGTGTPMGGPRGGAGMLVDPMMGMEGAYPPGGPAARPTGPALADTLTQRMPSPEYDIVRYQVTLIMRLEYLKVLETYLLSSNYHTINRIGLRDFTQPQPGQRASELASDLHYYGTEPVMEVTIEGELMLLSPWLRGKWDEAKKDWDPQFPPLMPVQVLMDLPANALRPEDSQRLAKARSSLVR